MLGHLGPGKNYAGSFAHDRAKFLLLHASYTLAVILGPLELACNHHHAKGSELSSYRVKLATFLS